ncbi:cellulose synthase subunit BcsC-related outer membrane protein [Steroidobacter flavus]|uniref:Cellulose synthase subunit BcsC-related outer membrane protein n=1 Tax=Steroidobacter flavus TaxID=1842136 RepID=A0ABV8SM06_9GAMM
MRSAALTIVCLLLLGRGALAAEPSIAGDELLQSARLWESRQRGDLARLALEKLVTTRPDAPEALLELGELHLRMSDFAAADQVLRRMEDRFPKSTATQSLSIQYRLATRDRLQWLSIQRLADLGKGSEVRQELQRLFPDGAPEGSIAIEYYRLLSITPGGQDEALRGLRSLAAKHPRDPRYQNALANMHPVVAAKAAAKRSAARPRPAPRAVATTPSVSPEALADATDWEARSRAATAAQQLQLASLQLQAASSLRTGDFESLIGIADRLESLGFAHQAGELLTVGNRLAPESTWLLETRVRWLVAHDEANQALQLIDARSLDDKWTAAKRDELRATALAARARVAVAASNEDAAIGDLTEAIELQPTDPWTRHRLASLLARRGQKEQGREVMDAGAALAPTNPQMRFAQALYLETIDDARQAVAAIEAVPPESRDTDMNAVRDRAQLTVVRELIDSGDTAQARSLLSDVRARANPDDLGVQLNIAYREWQLGDERATAEITDRLAQLAPERADVAMLAARAKYAQRAFGAARDYFKHAETVGDAATVLSARQTREQIENRLHNWMSVGAEMRHKPGDDGISSFDARVISSLWHHAVDYERRVWMQADAVSIDAGRLSADFDDAADFGSIRAAGPNAARHYTNDRQDGVALGVGYVTDNFAADIGSTPLGFELHHMVGGVEWRPDLPEVSMSLGFSRRAVRSSVLSYGGMRDPISGVRWGGAVQTGPYADAGLYRERYSIAGALRFSEITGEHIPDNKFLGARAAGDWKFFSQPYANASLGLALNYWQYDHNLQNYTLGNGGYYSPQSYVSVTLPLEVWGEYRDWSYRVRGSVAHSQSKTDTISIYPTDPALRSAVSSAVFQGDSSSGSTSFSAYAAVERQLSATWIIGMKLDIDRADYYDPTVFSIYLRHTLAPWTTRIAVPPRPIQPYNDK